MANKEIKELKDTHIKRPESMSITEWNEWAKNNKYPSLLFNPDFEDRLGELGIERITSDLQEQLYQANAKVRELKEKGIISRSELFVLDNENISIRCENEGFKALLKQKDEALMKIVDSWDVNASRGITDAAINRIKEL